MNCPRCNSMVQTVTEYFDFAKQYLIRDTYCSHCKSVTIEKFHSDSSYDSEWIDLNEQHRKE